MIFRRRLTLRASIFIVSAFIPVVLSTIIAVTAGVSAEKDGFLTLWEMLKSNNPSYLISYESYVASHKHKDKIWQMRPISVELEPVGWDKQGYRKQFVVKTAQLVELPRSGYLQASTDLTYDLAKTLTPKFSLDLAWPLFTGPDLAGLEKELNLLRSENSFFNTHNTMLLNLLTTYFACINGGNEVQEKELALAINDRLLVQGEKRYSAGLTDKEGLKRLQESHNRCQQSLQGAKTQLQRSRERLSLLVGGEILVYPKDGLIAEYAEYNEVLPPIESFMEEALQKRPDIAIMFLELEKTIAENAKNKALKGITGNIYLNYNYDEALFNGPHFFKTGLVFSYKLFDKQGQENYLQSQSAVDIKQKQIELRLREMGFELDHAYGNYFDLQENIGEFEGLCNKAKEEWHREKHLLKEGNSSPYKVDVAYLEYLSQRNYYYKMKQSLLLQYLQLQEAMGEKLDPETWDWLQIY